MRYFLFAILLLFGAPGADARQFDVVPGGEGLAATIAEASAGDRIVLLPGIHSATAVTIDKPLTIEGRPGAIVDGGGQGSILLVETNNVTIRDLHIRNTGVSYSRDFAAVKVENAKDCLFENNLITDVAYGFHIARSSAILVRSNTIHSAFTDQTSSGNGVHIWYGNNITITGNRITGQRDGIYLEFLKDGRITGNVCEQNLRYGLHFMFSDRSEYEDNVFRANGAGVAVMYTKNVTMRRNRFEKSWGGAAYGLLLKEINDSVVEDNLFLDNSIGMHAEGSTRVKLTGNTWDRNGWAVRIMGNCEDCVFHQNIFSGNAFDVGTNTRRNPNRFEGNFWGDYRGYDLDRDGVGDVPYHPVRLFAMLVEKNPPALIFLRSAFVSLLDVMESVAPALTPETLVDEAPLMRRPK
ncbi:MAG: nitrous oxide reductase family maturation protein NosD [Kiritimatiellae bacterium]|nr:nitrous oxide reductase family maturation protein NosD [Kiritimatiellia bacterium]